MMLYACHQDVSVLPRGATYALMCKKCCKHDRGSWEISEGFQSYRKGFITKVCKGCGRIAEQVKE